MAGTKRMSGSRQAWTPAAAHGPGPWRPGAMNGSVLGLGRSRTSQEIGLAVLSALSVASVWSSVCPSYFTFATFASQPEARNRAVTTCWIGFGLSTAAAAAIYFVFDEIVPAIVAEVTAVALLGISMYAIHGEPPKGVPAMEKQSAAAPAPSQPQATVAQPA